MPCVCACTFTITIPLTHTSKHSMLHTRIKLTHVKSLSQQGSSRRLHTSLGLRSQALQSNDEAPLCHCKRQGMEVMVYGHLLPAQDLAHNESPRWKEPHFKVILRAVDQTPQTLHVVGTCDEEREVIVKNATARVAVDPLRLCVCDLCVCVCVCDCLYIESCCPPYGWGGMCMCARECVSCGSSCCFPPCTLWCMYIHGCMWEFWLTCLLFFTVLVCVCLVSCVCVCVCVICGSGSRIPSARTCARAEIILVHLSGFVHTVCMRMHLCICMYVL
jgi:hypothetical protein